MRIVEVDAAEPAELAEVMAGQEIVHPNQTGAAEVLARGVVDAIDQAGAKGLILVTSFGTEDERCRARPANRTAATSALVFRPSTARPT